jgi:hypothetical protein
MATECRRAAALNRTHDLQLVEAHMAGIGAAPRCPMVGMLMFDAGGRYTNIQVRGDRPKYKSASAPTPEEIAANLRDFVAANFGRWSVNEADKTLTRNVDGAITPNTEGTEFKQTVSLSGDELRLTTVTPGPRGAAGSVDVFRRAR